MARAVDARAAAAPPPPPTTVVAIDFGTAATGYAIAQMPPPGHPITSARVHPFKPGDRASSATEKNLTAVLLDTNVADGGMRNSGSGQVVCKSTQLVGSIRNGAI